MNREKMTWLGRWRGAWGRAALVVGLALVAAGRAEAQYGYAGYGYGYAGYGYGWGMGMSPYDQALLKAQIYALNASQYALNIALAEQAEMSAVLSYETAVNTALRNRQLSRQILGETKAEGRPLAQVVRRPTRRRAR